MRVLIGEGDTLEELYAPPRLPWLRANMVGTVDGAATGADGLSGSINNAADKRVFVTLRAMADAVLVGAGTARAEGYRPTDRPLVVISRQAALPPQLLDGDDVLLATCASAPGLPAAREQLGDDRVLVLGEDAVDLVAVKATLVDRGLRHLLTEGGPHLLRDLLAAGVVDELDTTVVPRLVGGSHTRITAGDPVATGPLRLAGLVEDGDTLLCRWLPDTI